MTFESPGWKEARAEYHANRLKEPSPRVVVDNIRPKPTFPWLDMSAWDSQPVPERKWAIKDRVPLNQAGLFSGEGGTGKSIIELMKNVAHAAGKDWLGSLPEPGPAFYVGAEDEEDEIHIRLAAITGHYGVSFAELQGWLYVRCLLGEDATLCALSNKSGKVEPTKLYHELYAPCWDSHFDAIIDMTQEFMIGLRAPKQRKRDSSS
jgi:RecA-family ATPase